MHPLYAALSDLELTFLHLQINNSVTCHSLHDEAKQAILILVGGFNFPELTHSRWTPKTLNGARLLLH